MRCLIALGILIRTNLATSGAEEAEILQSMGFGINGSGLGLDADGASQADADEAGDADLLLALGHAPRKRPHVVGNKMDRNPPPKRHRSGRISLPSFGALASLLQHLRQAEALAVADREALAVGSRGGRRPRGGS